MREPLLWLVLIAIATSMGFLFAYFSSKRKREQRKTLAKNLIKEDRRSQVFNAVVEEHKKEITNTSSE
ncbi:MAG: hypothetical protein ABGX24_02875 [Aquificota bacterium]|jgi:hypothetical protein